ncbi:TrmB family transcriptional regulator [Candidatus Woesearchaeota archaeon]|nr:TrmB family transcriptional regulator [Candidatus Woesearchaeota archaeon]
MLVKNELVAKIKDYFDLNIYETKVWLALLGKGSASAGEIATISGVPRSRTYDVLESLEKKGFALVKLGKPVKYLGVKPKIILEKLKNNVRVEAEERVKSLGTLRETDEFQQLEELYTAGINPVKREELSASIKGKNLIVNHLREIIDSATEEVIMVSFADEIKLKEKIYLDLFSQLKKRGIKIKISLSGDIKTIKDLEKVLSVKINKLDVNAKFFIVDRKEVLFYLSPETTKEDQAIWINSEFFSEGFAGLFDLVMKE